jgi:hypothetical protein
MTKRSKLDCFVWVIILFTFALPTTTYVSAEFPNDESIAASTLKIPTEAAVDMSTTLYPTDSIYVDEMSSVTGIYTEMSSISGMSSEISSISGMSFEMSSMTEMYSTTEIPIETSTPTAFTYPLGPSSETIAAADSTPSPKGCKAFGSK